MVKNTVIVIGGGIAGLTAASELCRHGRHVTLLEARPRLGGRIHTTRCGDLPIELGAEFIHGTHIPLWAQIDAARLSTHEVPNRNQFFENGRLHPVELWDRIGEVFARVEPRKPDESVAAFLSTANLDERTRRIAKAFMEGFNAADTERISSHAVLRAEYASQSMNGDRQFRIDSGYGSLVQCLADQIAAAGAAILTSSQVTQVSWRNGFVQVDFEQQGALRKCEAERAVVALPLGVLKAQSVTFRPGLPDKVEAANGLEFGNVVKLAYVFSRHWWPQHDFGFVHAFDLPVPTWWADRRGNVLTGWAGGPKADALLRKSPEEREAIGLSALATIFGQTLTSLSRLVIACYSHDWASDPLSAGAYSYIPVNGLDLPRLLGAPVHDTLFFAGEATATDAQMGTVFGAFASGLRAASELVSTRK